MENVYEFNDVKVCEPSEVSVYGKPYWVEIADWEYQGKNDEGIYWKKIHKLMRCTVEDWHGNGILTLAQYPDRCPSIYVSCDRYRESFVFWGEKPAEPYFKDGWPEWVEL